MLLLTRASAADLTSSSLTLQAKRFQLFQPMGGVRARPFSRVCAGKTKPRNERNKSRLNKSDFLWRAFISFLRLLFPCFFQKRNGEIRSPPDAAKTPLPAGQTTT